MDKESEQHHEQNVKDLVVAARSLYESAMREEGEEKLELLRRQAVELKPLLDTTFEKEGSLHPDLGLTLLLFIELKKDGNEEWKADARDADAILTTLEEELAEEAN